MVGCRSAKQLGHIVEAKKRGGHIEQIDCTCFAFEYEKRMGRDQFAKSLDKIRIRSNDWLLWQLGQSTFAVTFPDRDLEQFLYVGKDILEPGNCLENDKRQ